MASYEQSLIGDWRTKVGINDYPRLRSVTKFGRNKAVGTSEEDIITIGGKETLLGLGGATMYMSCEDNTNGVGQVITVDGLDEAFHYQTGRCTLTGQTQSVVTLNDGSAALWTRINRAYQISVDPDPVGNVWIAESDTLTAGVPDTTTKIHGEVIYTDAAQQTQKCAYTVPHGHFMVFYGSQAFLQGSTSGSARFCEIGIEVQVPTEGYTDTNITWAPWRRTEEYGVSTANTAVEHMLLFPQRFEEYTNVSMRAKASATCDISGSMEFLIVPYED